MEGPPPAALGGRGVEPPPGQDLSELILAPENGHFFGALGAVEFGAQQEEAVGRYQGLRRLEEVVEGGGRATQAGQDVLGLCSSPAEFDAFMSEFGVGEPPVRLVGGPHTPVFLGVDGGSTSTKAVLLDRGGSLLAKAYRLSRGNPIQDAIDLVADIRVQVERAGAEVEIRGAATTGYAKDVLRKVLGADTAVVETVAHAQSSLHLFQDPEVLVDVGGQDIKLIVLRDGHVKDFMLNTQCSAGNGYFLQATAESLGLKVEDYAQAAFSARKMPEFSYGCAVFLQSDLVDYQRQGWRPEELLAGLAAVLPRNIWLYVAKIANLSTLGTRFVLQGGTQRNLAAVKAQVDYIRAQFRRYGKTPEIVVHPHCGEAGAIGAALEARRLWEGGMETRFPGLKAVEGISYTTTTGPETLCRLCRNRCLRTFVDFRVPMNGKRPKDRFIVAGCEKGAADGKASLKSVVADMAKVRKGNPDLTEEAAKGVWASFHPSLVSDSPAGLRVTPGGRKRRLLKKGRESLSVGMPRVLGMYQHAPFFSAYFESLGVPWEHLVFSDFTTDEMFREGSRRGAIDPCFPAKVVVAHVHNLLQKKKSGQALDLIFNPMLDTHRSPMVSTEASNACSTVIAAPQTAFAMFIKEKDVFAEHGVRHLHPILEMSNEGLLARQLFQTFRDLLGLTEDENRLAVGEGFRALSKWDERIRAQGKEVLEMLQTEGRLGIVILGRSYHHDPGLNHGVFREFQKLGYPVLSQDTLPMDPATLQALFGEDVREGFIQHPLDVSDVWKHTYIASTAMKLWAAKFVARHPNLVGVEFSNFKCGHDAVISQVIQKVIECAGMPFFSFRDVDENKPSGSFKVRIETIHYFLQRHSETLLNRGVGISTDPFPFKSSVDRFSGFSVALADHSSNTTRRGQQGMPGLPMLLSQSEPASGDIL